MATDLRSWIVDFPRLKRMEPGFYATLHFGRRYLIKRVGSHRWTVERESHGEFFLAAGVPSLAACKRFIATLK